MHQRQNFRLLFFPKNSKTNKNGETSIYCRLTIDGLQDEFSTSIKIRKEYWDKEAKTVVAEAPNYKAVTKGLREIAVDLERHFHLVQATNGLATPAAVIQSYETPINGQGLKEQKQRNTELSTEVDRLIEEFVLLHKKRRQQKERCLDSPENALLFEKKRELLAEEITSLVKAANKIYDNPKWVKTLMLAVDEYLLNFLQLAVAGERSPNTLEKWMGRKKRYFQFLQYRYKASDIPLSDLQFKFMGELKTYIMVHHHCDENTATKYAQCIKEIMERAANNKWVTANVFSTFRCSYRETDMNWLTLDNMIHFSQFEFSKAKYKEARDVYVAMSFLGYAYADIHAAEPEDIFIGLDGERWISRNRQKTGEEEALPVLPIVQEIFDKYRNHPLCVRKNRLLPVPSNAEFNRCLKEMGVEIGYKLLTEKKKGSHRARYFMINEVLDRNGVPIKTTGKIAGQKCVRTTEKYLRPNKKQISKHMANVRRNMFDEQGKLIAEHTPPTSETTAPTFTPMKVVHFKAG